MLFFTELMAFKVGDPQFQDSSLTSLGSKLHCYRPKIKVGTCLNLVENLHDELLCMHE